MGTKVPWLLASKASEFAKESDFQTTKSQLDDFAKVSGDYITEGDADKKYETKEDAKKYWKPEVTEDGVIDWTLTDTTTKPTQRNIKGDKGDDGDDGVSPHIGDNGNWFIGTEDTNVEAKGPKGDAFKYEDFTPAQLEALKGDPGDPGEPGHSPEITTQVDTANNAVKILADDEVIGTIKNGKDGSDGVSPTVSSEETTDETGRTGTKVTITYDGEESPEEFTIWNGKDGAAGDLPAAPDGAGKYVLEKTADSKIQWHNLDNESSTLTGVENQITVTTVGTETSVGLAEKVITQLGKLDDQLTLAEGTGITFDTTEDGVLKISSTGGAGGKPIKGVDGQISVTDKTAYDEVGLHENVLAKLEELENPLTITGGDNIDVVEGENDTVVINYTGKEFPADGLHDGLNVLSANGTDYEWVPGEQYYAYIKTYDQDGKPDINALAQNVMIETHANNVSTNYNRIRGNVGSKTFETYTLPNHWSKMFVSGTNDTATAGEFVTVTPGAGNGNNISWYDIEPKLSDTAEGMQGWDASNKKWAKIEAGETYKFDTATLSGTGSTENPIGVDTDALNEMYLPLTGGTITGVTMFDRCNIEMSGGNVSTRRLDDNGNPETHRADFFSFGNVAWMKSRLEGDPNEDMGALGVSRSPRMNGYDPDGLVAEGTPIAGLQCHNDVNGWREWQIRYIFPNVIHAAGTQVSDTWENDNTLHFILE